MLTLKPTQIVTNERIIFDKTKQKLNCDKHKKFNCVQVKTFFFFTKFQELTNVYAKKDRTLELQHLAADMYSVQSFVVSKVNKKKIGN